MKLKIICIAKTKELFIEEGIAFYLKKLKPYTKLEWIEVNTSKIKLHQVNAIKEAEAELILKNIASGSTTFLLDEKGKQMHSRAFADLIQQQMNQSVKEINFVVGGAYGFADSVYQKADFLLSLSKMTFSHQIVRCLFLEQLYRSFTIINNEPYHHD